MTSQPIKAEVKEDGGAAVTGTIISSGYSVHPVYDSEGTGIGVQVAIYIKAEHFKDLPPDMRNAALILCFDQHGPGIGQQ